MRRAWTRFAIVALGLCVGCAISDEGGLRWLWVMGAVSVGADLYRDRAESRDTQALDETLRRMGRAR